MNPAYRLASVHIGLLVLSIPLLILLYLDGLGAGSGHAAGKWAYVALAAVYVMLGLSAKPRNLFKGFYNFGISKRATQLVIFSVALFSASVPLYDLNVVGTALAVVALVGALTSFLWAIAVSLFVTKPEDCA